MLASFENVNNVVDAFQRAAALSRMRKRRPFGTGPVRQKMKRAKMDDDGAKGEWKTVGSDDLYIFTPKRIEHRAKIAGFDVDYTIVRPKSTKTFAENSWEFVYPHIPDVIRELHEKGYKVVFFTNQAAISKGKKHLPSFKRKIEAICAKLPVPVQVFVSPGTHEYLKPYIGMWVELEKNQNGGVRVDRCQSMYVGNAAGRAATENRDEDTSCCDRMFALNLGVKFATPEEYFLGAEPEPFTRPAFDACKVLNSPGELFEPPTAVMPSNKQEIIVLVGFPGSGKSTFAHRYENKGYVVVSYDKLKSSRKCVKVAKRVLENGKSVIIDDANPDEKSRKRYINLAKACKVDCRCFVMTCDFDQAQHNLKFRNIMDTGKKYRDLDEVITRMYKNKLEEPSVTEGFREIVKVNFVPIFDDGSDPEKVYRMVLVEK